MSTDSFHIVLPSNTPVEGNKTSEFVVRLPNQIDFDSNWTVSLSSVIFPISFVSFGEPGDEDKPQFIKIFFIGKDDPVIAYIPSITYTSVSELEEAVNNCLRGAIAMERLTQKAHENRNSQRGSDQREKKVNEKGTGEKRRGTAISKLDEEKRSS